MVFDDGNEPTSYSEHYINLTNDPLIAVPSYRVSPQKAKILRTEVQQTSWKNNIFEECGSLHAALTVLVSNKGGTFRMYVGYCKLNSTEQISSSAYERFDVHCYRLFTCQPFTLKVREIDCDKTAFIIYNKMHRR